MSPQERIVKIDEFIVSTTLTQEEIRGAIAEEQARDPLGEEPRYLVYTGQEDCRVYVDYYPTRDRGNFFGYQLGQKFGVRNVYRFQSYRQAELVAQVTKNGKGERGRVCTYMNALEESLKNNERLLQTLREAKEVEA